MRVSGSSRLIGVLLIALLAIPAVAHDVPISTTVVIDTDMGLDDAVTLAAALQSPRVDITAIVATEGVASAAKCVEHAERMLDLFNRRDVPLHAAAAPAKGLRTEPPPFRAFAESRLSQALPACGEPFHRRFAPEAYASERGKVVILALGPLTNIAAALRAKPDLKDGIREVVVAGGPEPGADWNIDYDRAALAAVRASGVSLKFIVPGPAAQKPTSWREGNRTLGPGTSIGEGCFNRLLQVPDVRQHYVEKLSRFFDEVAFAYVLDATLFDEHGETGVFEPKDRGGLLRLLTRSLVDGRQQKTRVVFTADPFPDKIFQEDVRRRKARIIAAHGETEWLAQVLMNELHQHLGAYSVIGVKMGLRAAELLNAPQHSMRIISHVAGAPPVSCLNDGLIVSTGCTPGRRLFEHKPETTGDVKVTFEYNGRRVILCLKPEYRQRIRAEIAALLQKYTLEDHEYWHGVRAVGLDIWETWHRRDLFEVATERPSD